MKRFLFKGRIGRLGLTNPVACVGGGRWGCVPTLNDGHIDPIVVCRGRFGAQLILDGNQRACCCFRHDRTINVLMVERERDRDDILELEAEGMIMPFPHRLFLMGEHTLRDLVRTAERSAFELGSVTVKEAVTGFATEGDGTEQ